MKIGIIGTSHSQGRQPCTNGLTKDEIKLITNVESLKLKLNIGLLGSAVGRNTFSSAFILLPNGDVGVNLIVLASSRFLFVAFSYSLLHHTNIFACF